jgi:hypothetical protein
MASERLGFAPYRIPPGALPEEAARRAADGGEGPLLARADEPLPAALVSQALALVPAGMAGAPDEACRAADGTVAGSAEAPRACLNSARHRARVEAAVRRALESGFAGVCLELPDAPVAAGVLGAGFCAECQRAFGRELVREYGDHFQPFDLLSMARQAVASSPGAVSHERLAFGRELWRARLHWLDEAVGSYARAARDAARAAARPFEVAARFAAVGPGQLRAARHLDDAVFPVAAQGQGSGAGLFRLLRAAMGQRPCAVSVDGGPLSRLASVAASCGVELLGSSPEAEAALAAVRRFARAAAAAGRTPLGASPVAECAVLYSSDSDLWSGGEHREQLEWTGEALAALQIQAPVVLRPSEAPPGAVLVLPAARALSPLQAQEVRRRLEAGGGVLCLGAPGGVDEAGRPAPLPFPPGKPGGERVEKGTLVRIAERAAPGPGAAPETWARAHGDLSRALALLLGRGRRAASTAGRSPLLVALHRQGERLDVHLAALDAAPAKGTTLFLGLHVAGEARRGRFKASNGPDERVPLNPSGYAISTVLPTFEGYAVLSIPG